MASSGNIKQITLPNGNTYDIDAVRVNGHTVNSDVPANAVFTDNNTTYTFANGTNGFTVTPSGGSAQTVTVTPSITNNVTGSGTSGYLTKFNGANTITNGPQLGSGTATYLRNDGSWASPDDRYPLYGGIGTAIPANADLNTYKTPGTYYSENSTRSGTLSNTPHTSSGFKLYVEYSYGSTRIYQTIKANAITDVYVRYYNASSWSAWKRPVTIENGSAVGSTTQPVYVKSSGEVATTTYSLSASVPSGAKFTDTTYTLSADGADVKLTPSSGNATTANLSSLINGLSTGSNTPADDDYFVSQYVGGGTSNTNYYRRKISTLWTYIKSKITAAVINDALGTTPVARATGDADGNAIKTSYAASFSISDHTITLKNKAGNSLGTVTVPDNNTWTAMTGATSSANGTVGYVNAVPPKDGYNTKYLRADGTWAVPPDNNTWTAMTGATSSANGTVGYVNATPPKNGYNTKYLRADGTWAVPPDNNTWTAMTGATSSANGTVGYVNAVPPKDGYNTKYLRADGTWAIPPDNNDHYTTNIYAGSGTAANAATTNGNTKVTIADNTTVRGSITIKGTGATTVSSDAAGVITIDSTDNNTNNAVTQTISSTSNADYRVLFSSTADDTTRTEGARKDTDFKYNPSTNTLTVANVAGNASSASSVPITGVTPGNNAQSGGIDSVTAAYIPTTASNKSFGLPAAAIVIEYSTDGGSTWTSYGATDDQKRDLFNESRSTNFYLGKASAKASNTVNNQLRVTIEPTDRYCSFHGIYVWFSTQGNTCVMDLARSTIGSKDSFTNVFTGQAVSGWSGNNIRYFSQGQFGGGSSQTGNTYKYRVTFRQTAINSNYPSAIVNDIRFIGHNLWTAPNSSTYAFNMVKNGVAYSADRNGNVTFPAGLTATNFNGYTIAKSVPADAKFTDTTYTAQTTSIGSASAGTAISADDITNWEDGSVPSLTYTARSVGSASGWSAGTAASASVTNGVLVITNGTAPSLTITSVACDDITAWDAGSVPTLTYTSRSIPNISVTSKTVATGITAS